MFIPPLNQPGRSLANAPEVWSYRRDLWTQQGGAFIAGSQVFPVQASLPALHFTFDGASFELLFAGTGVQVIVIANGQPLARRFISTEIAAGSEGAALSRPNAMVRFDLGSARVRQLSVYARSSQGPCALVVPSGTTVMPWDRSAEPSFSAMTDSYGQSVSAMWGTGGPYWVAAARLALPHLAIDAIGGTGYAPNNANADTRNPARAFTGRTDAVSRTQPDLLITAGGVNDNNWFATPPLFPTEADARASFEAAVPAYFQALRAALPGSVLVALGPWTPPRDPTPSGFVQLKMDTIRNALQAIPGPWVLLDNIADQWVTSSGAASSAANRRWITGRGWQGSPAGDGGNADAYISADGTHPNEAGCDYLGSKIADALRLAITAL